MKKLLRTVFIVLLTVTISLFANVSEETILRDCKGVFASGKYQEAILSINRFLRNNPKSQFRSEALYWKGLAFLSDSKMDSAIIPLRQVQEKDRFWYSRANLSLAVISAGEQNWQASAEYLKKTESAKDSSVLSSVWFQKYSNSLKQNLSKQALIWKDSLLKRFPRAMELSSLKEEATEIVTPKGEGGALFTLQLGAFQDKGNSEALAERISKKSLGNWKPEVKSQIRSGSRLFVVLLGQFDTEVKAKEYANKIGLVAKEFRIIGQ